MKAEEWFRKYHTRFPDGEAGAIADVLEAARNLSYSVQSFSDTRVTISLQAFWELGEKFAALDKMLEGEEA